MRLWHKALLPGLSDNQLRGQWRECCLIAKGLRDGNLNHLLVNKVKEYPLGHLFAYGMLVAGAMQDRGMVVNDNVFRRYFPTEFDIDDLPLEFDDVFAGWHNQRYLTQCFYNLQEKYDCGGISADEWERLSLAAVRALERVE